MKHKFINIIVFLLGWQFGHLLMGEQAHNLGFKAGKYIKKIIWKVRNNAGI